VEIEIRREGLWTALIVLLLALLGGMGYGVSPQDEQGRPLLLLPGVRAVETYRRQVVGWARDWRELDGDLRAILSEVPATSLLAQSQKAQDSFERAVELARRVERTDAPPALLGLREQVGRTATAYVDASAAVNRWLSAPSEENRTAAQQLSEQAFAMLARLAANEWVAAAPTAQP